MGGGLGGRGGGLGKEVGEISAGVLDQDGYVMLGMLDGIR